MTNLAIKKGRKQMANLSEQAPAEGSVQHINPDGLPRNPAFTNVVVVTGPTKTVYVGG